MPHIRVQDAPHFRIPLAPLEEQRRVVSYLDGLQAKVDALKSLQAQTQARCASTRCCRVCWIER